jgi:uncharacterized protein with HEPN domain
MKACRPYLVHILQEIDYLLQESSVLGFEQFALDATRKRAFIRSLERLSAKQPKISRILSNSTIPKLPGARWPACGTN